MKTKTDASSWLTSYISSAELDKVCNKFELWKIEESSAALNTLTHGFFRYFGKFPPPVATRFIKKYHDSTIGPVVDPMVGSGTTLVEAILLNRVAVGFDVNPLSALIAKVKTTPIVLEKIEKVTNSYADFWEKASKLDCSDLIPQDKYLDHWFFRENQDGIAKTVYFIDHFVEDIDVKDMFRVALAASIRRLSRASNGLGRMFLEPAKTPNNVQEIITKQLNKMAVSLRELSLFRPNIQVQVKDAQEPFLPPNFTNLVITHPPYFNLYKYTGIYKFEMMWLGFEIENVRAKEVTDGFKVGKKNLVFTYADDMAKVLTNIHQVLVPDGHCVLMIGDTVLRGERINTTYLTLKLITEVGFEVEEIIVRQPKFTEASYAATQRRTKDEVGVKLADYLVVLRKK